MTTKTKKQDTVPLDIVREAALVAARNAAHDAQQEYADITCSFNADSLGKLGVRRRQAVADKLYEATRELIHHIDNNLREVNNSSDGFHCTWCGLDANGHQK
jgi:hypothetical protein